MVRARAWVRRAAMGTAVALLLVMVWTAPVLAQVDDDEGFGADDLLLPIVLIGAVAVGAWLLFRRRGGGSSTPSA